MKMTQSQFASRLQFIKSYSGTEAGIAAEEELFADLVAVVAAGMVEARKKALEDAAKHVESVLGPPQYAALVSFGIRNLPAR